MATCNFVRKNTSGYEYGLVVTRDTGTKQESRSYEVHGSAETMDEALLANSMVLAGMPRIGVRVDPLKGWT